MFSKAGTYPAVGLFTVAHIISIFICFFLIGLAVFLTRKMKKETYFKCLRVFAILLTGLELFKIIWALCNGERNVNAWVPLYFCSIFIYSLWFTYSKNKHIKNLGLSYIAMAGIVCGAIFIISPSTSFRTYPIFHFQCLYSMIYHSIMVYSGIMIFVTKAFKLNLKSVWYYCGFCGIFMVLALVVNLSFGGNMMFLSSPSGIPLPFLIDIYNFSKVVYTICIIIAHLIFIGFGMLGIYNAVEHVISKNQKIVEELQNEDMEEKEI